MILNGESEQRKHCPDCRQDLPPARFTQNARSRDGLAFYCAVWARADIPRASASGLARRAVALARALERCRSATMVPRV